MKKELNILGIIFILVVVSSPIIGYWHQQEVTARGIYKIESLCLIDDSSEVKSVEYFDSLKEAKGIVWPKKCPYCFVESLIK